MKRMNKDNSRKRWAELRGLWNEYDPIGVVQDPHGPNDEYDSYVGPTMRLLEKGTPVEQIVSYLESVSEYMGIDFDRESATQFAVRSKHWFGQNWPETYV